MVGRGGMADVFRATDLRLGREVAIKILRADLARDPQFLARFGREAQAVARLNHNSIVSVYDSGEQISQQGHADAVHAPYIVMEFVHGQTIKSLIKSGQLTVEKSIDYVYSMLGALEYSHRAGIVHRDIKPANVMVDVATGAIKVMDFGIARAVADSSSTMTQTQAVVGTAQYLSPEQALGESVDARSDIYSAGCMFYEMLTGKPPFQGDSPVSVAYQHVQGTVVPPSRINPEVSPAVDSVVAKALSKDREDRFSDAGEFRRALRAAQHGITVAQLCDAAEQPTAAQAVIDPELIATSALGTLPAAGAGADSADTTAMALPEMDDPQQLTSTNALDLTQEQWRVLIPELEHQQKKRRKKRRGLALTMTLLFLMIVGGGAYGLYLYLNRPPEPPPMIAVPSVSKLSESDALARLFGAGLRPDGTIERKASTTVPKGEALGTDPEEGKMVAENGTVKLIVSAGPSSASVPTELSGKTEAFARDQLRAAGLVGGGTTFANSQSVPANMVITTKPEPGKVVPIDSAVEIVISTGKVDVPDVTDKPLAEATSVLKGLGLQVVTRPQNSEEVAEGTVLSQSVPTPGSIEQGGTVTLHVARKPPPPSPTPEPTPSSATDSPSASPRKSSPPEDH